MEVVLGDQDRGVEDDGQAASSMGYNDPVLDNVCPNDHLLCGASHDHASFNRELPNSYRIFNGLLCRSKLISLALYDRVIMPLMKKWKGKQGFTDLQKIGIGLTLSLIGMVAAAIAEARRLAVAKHHGTSDTHPITVFTLIPQLLTVGAGEAFIYTGQPDFFLTRSPEGMKTMSTGLFLTTLSLGFFFSSALVTIVNGATAGGGDGQGWLADNINLGRLDLFYWLLAVLCAMNLVAYLITAAWTEPQTLKVIVEMISIPAEKKC